MFNKGLKHQTIFTQKFSLSDDVLELRIEGEEKPIGGTSEHPFFVKNRLARSDTSAEGDGEWLEAIHLQAGDLIRTSNGRWAKVVSIRPKGEARVYNFTVEKNHNYFVGNLRLLTHILFLNLILIKTFLFNNFKLQKDETT